MQTPKCCPFCGREFPPTHGNTKYCTGCRKKTHLLAACEASRRLYHRRRDAGLCPQCGDPVTDGHAYCAVCRRIAGVKRKERNARKEGKE